MNNMNKKMNLKFLASLALIALLVTSCTKKDDPDFAGLLKGTWVNTMVNEQPVLTDATFVMDFGSDNKEMYASGFQFDETNKSWMENANYTYDIEGNLLGVIGVDVRGNLTQIEFKIESITNETTTFSVLSYKENGNVFADNNIYTFRKVSNDYSNQFIGVWYGRCTTEGAADSLYHYWEYFEDGTYNYYYQDDASNWIKKSDNEGGYFLYGNLMVSNYSHDLLSGGTGSTYECWNFSIVGNKMVWTGLRANNITITYEMEKVSSPPETIN